jgi:chemotaxis protein MotB
MKPIKTKVTCYECGSSYSLDLSRLAPQVHKIKCMKCGKPVPILQRVLQAKTEAKPTPSEDEPKSSKKETPPADFQLYSDPDMAITETADGGEEGGGWLASYGDMITILMAFFVLMFAISNVDKKKFEIAMQSVNNALGGTLTFPRVDAPSSSSSTSKTIPPNPLDLFKTQVQTEKDTLAAVREQLQKFIVENRLQDRFTLLDENDGLVLIAQDMTMFDLGRAEIHADVLVFLRKIGAILRVIENDIAVEGHTDDLPIHSGRFSSNWELSVMRATNVVHFLVAECGLDPKRLAAAGYAYYRPRFALDSSEKEKNRRIEMVVRKKYADNLVDELLQPN